MGISTKGRYGIRFMMDLALRHSRGAVALKEVAQRQGISEKYLWQVLAPLKTKGLIAARRGSRGGYALARLPSTITVRDIVTTIEGEHLLVTRSGGRDPAEGKESPAVRSLWEELEVKLTDAMEQVTLQDLADRETARQQAAGPSYAI
jgi:Rrf2 family protein